MPLICQEYGHGREEEDEPHHQELPHLHQAQPKNKTKSNAYIIKKKTNVKVVAHKVGKMKTERGWNQHTLQEKRQLVMQKKLFLIINYI
jgi:hypothetical protein